MSEMASIIVPFYNRWDLTHRVLFELYQYVTAEDVEVLLVDDGSTESGIDGGLAFWQKQVQKHKIRVVRHAQNGGFGKACNTGLEKAEGEIKILLSNDVHVRGDFVPLVRQKLMDNSRSLIGGEVIDFAGGWNEIEYKGGKSVVPYANGWFLAAKKEVWAELEGFDPRYGYFDFEDIDLSTTAHWKGITVTPLGAGRMLAHEGGATIRSMNVDRLQQTLKNQKLYLDKWQDKWQEIFEEVKI